LKAEYNVITPSATPLIACLNGKLILIRKAFRFSPNLETDSKFSNHLSVTRKKIILI